MNIKMISPRTIFDRKPIGRNFLQINPSFQENYPESNFSESDKKEFWVVRSILDQQLELYVNGCCAVLHNFTFDDHCHMLTAYTDTPIKCVSFGCLSQKASTNASIESIFQDLESSIPKGIFLFTETVAKYFGFKGENHSCKLPCEVSSAWNFRNCVFVERQESPITEAYSPHSLFLMSHTLAEFTPVVFKNEFGHTRFINDTRFRIVATCEVSFLLLAYDKEQDIFSLWKVRDAIREDFAELYDKHLDGSVAVNREKLRSNSFSMTSYSGLGQYTHVSSQYLQCGTDGSITGISECSIDNLDLRSPIARSIKSIKDAEKPEKMTLLHEMVNQASRPRRPPYRQIVEPLYPKVCLDFLLQFKSGDAVSCEVPQQPVRHSTPMVNGSGRPKRGCAIGFFAEDFHNRRYICCLRRAATGLGIDDGEDAWLHVLQLAPSHHGDIDSQITNGGGGDELPVSRHRVKDAVYLARLRLIVVLECNSSLSLFSGLAFVCKISLLNALIHEPDIWDHWGGGGPDRRRGAPDQKHGARMLSSNKIHSLHRLSEATETGFTMMFRDDAGTTMAAPIDTVAMDTHALRLYLPEMVRFPLVRRCLIALKRLLPVSTGTVLLARWYSLNRAVDSNEASTVEWRRFVDFVLEQVGFARGGAVPSMSVPDAPPSGTDVWAVRHHVQLMSIGTPPRPVRTAQWVRDILEKSVPMDTEAGRSDEAETAAASGEGMNGPLFSASKKLRTDNSVSQGYHTEHGHGHSESQQSTLRGGGAIGSATEHLRGQLDRLQQFCALALRPEDRLLSRHAGTVLLALHLVFEAVSQSALGARSPHLERLGALVSSLALSLVPHLPGATHLIDYYMSYGPGTAPHLGLPALPVEQRADDNPMWLGLATADSEWCPPDWGRWCLSVFPVANGTGTGTRYPILEDVNDELLQLARLWLVMFCDDDRTDPLIIDRYLYGIRHLDSGQGHPVVVSVAMEVDMGDGGTVDVPVYERVTRYLREAAVAGRPVEFPAQIEYVAPVLATVLRHVLTRAHQVQADRGDSYLLELRQRQHEHSGLASHRYLGHRLDLDQQCQLIDPLLRDNAVPEVIASPLQKLRQVGAACLAYNAHWVNHVRASRSPPNLSRTGCPVGPSGTGLGTETLLALLHEDPAVQLAFPDMRVKEAYKMLQSCCPIDLDVTVCTHFSGGGGDDATGSGSAGTAGSGGAGGGGGGGPDSVSSALKEELEAYLKMVNCQRTFSLPVGRGMLGLHVLGAAAFAARVGELDKLPVPPMCLAGRFSLSESGKPQPVENSTSVKQWPNFHNGVAAALMVSPINPAIDFVWILKQLSSNNIDKIELTSEQAGILLGLGLNGHLNKLSPDTIGQTIKSMNEMATMAILIGLSAFNLGSKNSFLSKHISFHYRRLIPGEKDQTDPIPTLCQVAAIMSAGLLNFQSGDLKMARIFIEEMGRSREHLAVDGSPPMDIELTAVTAGFSVGLILFQHGDALCREYNPDELTRLLSYLKGSHRVQPRENGLSEVPSDSHIRMILKNHDLKKPQPISEVDNWNTYQAKNPRVQEGEYYNVDVTGSGAAVALGLIFMASSNEIIAQHLECPNTFYLLEQIRSPLLCFRQIAHGLVMWKRIAPTKHWVDSTIPDLVSSKAFVLKPPGIAEKYLETANESYLQMLVGSCFVLGLRYAGTDSVSGRRTIMGYVQQLLLLKTSSPELMQYTSRNQLDWAISTLFLSACMISAGSGDLELLQMGRFLRSIHHPKECSNYGVYLTCSMATGLLFLGGGKLTLANTPRCAALLLIAFFPRFPPTYSGRRYHLQSLRHLYVIATRPRVLCAVDLDSQTAVPVDSLITFKSGETRQSENSCFVYPLDNPARIKQIEIFDKQNKYWRQTYKPDTHMWTVLRESLLNGGYFFVQKKPPGNEIENLANSIRIDCRTRSDQIVDYRLLVQFFDAVQQRHGNTNSSESRAALMQRVGHHVVSELADDDRCWRGAMSIHGRIIDHIMEHESALKQLVYEVLPGLDTRDRQHWISLLHWAQGHPGVMRAWTVFSSYFRVSLHSIRNVLLNGHDSSLPAYCRLEIDAILK